MLFLVFNWLGILCTNEVCGMSSLLLEGPQLLLPKIFILLHFFFLSPGILIMYILYILKLSYSSRKLFYFFLLFFLFIFQFGEHGSQDFPEKQNQWDQSFYVGRKKERWSFKNWVT